MVCRKLYPVRDVRQFTVKLQKNGLQNLKEIERVTTTSTNDCIFQVHDQGNL
jgi:hypothetical protein